MSFEQLNIDWQAVRLAAKEITKEEAEKTPEQREAEREQQEAIEAAYQESLREKRSEAAKKAAKTRKANQKAFEDYEKEMEGEPPLFPQRTKEETERRSAEFLRKMDPRHVERRPSIWLPPATFKIYRKVRKPREGLFPCIVRLLDEELVRHLEKELKAALEKQGDSTIE